MSHNLRRISMAFALIAVAAGAGVNHAARAPAGDNGHGLEISDTGLHLVLNVAGNWLYVYENGERTRTYSVSVGLPGYETPKGDYRINEVIWNPSWHPPNSAWARGRTPAAPGDPDNPMGRVKIYFAPLLYIHGTPEAETIGTPASRGCVRMRNSDVIELTHLIHKYASPRVSSELIARLEASPTMNRSIRLQQPVRFTAHYEVATIENGFLIIYPDIYGLVKRELKDQVEHTLEQNGIDLRRVNQEHLERLVEKGGTRRVAISLDSLVSGRALGATQDPDAEH